MKQLTKRYQFEIYPSPVQKQYLAQIFGSVRFVYNEFVKSNEDMWGDGKIQRLSRSEMQELLPVYKEALPWLSEIPSQALQVATHDLDAAYQNFFQGRGKKPTTKKLSERQSFSLPQPKIKNVSGQMCLFLPNYKTHIPIRMHREFPKNSKLGSATITKTPSGKYFISVVTTFSSREVVESKNDKTVGIDLNLKDIVLSTGTKIKTPQILTTLEKRKRRLQKSMQRQRDMAKKDSRELKSSQNYQKNRIKSAKIFESIKNQKEDFLHKVALSIYRENQAVSMETLNVKGMMKNRRLSRAVSFQSWGRLVEIMKMYAIQYDKQLHLISTWFPSSKICHACGLINQELTLGDREWVCECGCTHDRDINAAINIQNEGGSCPVYKPVERKGSVRRPKGKRTTMASVKQESSEFEVVP